MIVVKFRGSSIISDVACLVARIMYLMLNTPKGATGIGKNNCMFLEHILLGRIGENMGIGVENF
jgi:hypothetical protein